MADPRPDLKDLIMVQYAGLVERTARKFSGIRSVRRSRFGGYIGLLNALSKFDPTAGVRFNTYATYLVAGRSSTIFEIARRRFASRHGSKSCERR